MSLIQWWISISVCAGVAILYSLLTAQKILSLPSGDEKMRAIAQSIQEGASAYLKRQYQTIAYVGIVVMAFFWFAFSNSYIAIGFLIGAVLSSLSGYLGMWVSVRANVRTTQAACQSLKFALSVAFRSGAITGFLVNGLGLIGVVGYAFLLWSKDVPVRAMIEGLVALGFGASLISIFARLGGGIFTKGADVGADLVGKIEAGIPEDDPRNPAVIADNVGDNVGDCAGMSADLFETYVVTLVAAMQMAFIQWPSDAASAWWMAMYPLAIGAVSVLGSLLGTFFVRLTTSIMGALYKGLIAAMVFCTIGIASVMYVMPNVAGVDKMPLFLSCLVGIVLTGLLVWQTEYYTACQYRPVRSIAKASQTGAGTNLIQGLAMSMESCFSPVLIIGAGMLLVYSQAQLFGIALASVSMLALMGMIIAIDAYGPVTDNAGGIAEMAGLPPQVREITDQLDAVGNTTKAVTKGYAIGSAVLAALVLFSAYTHEIGHYLPDYANLSFDLRNPMVVVGLLIGGAVPYLFSAMCMQAVGHAASFVVIEVRRQFKEIKNIMQYTVGQASDEGRPDYGKAVDILTKASIQAMVIPSLLPVLLPIGLYAFGKMFYSVEAALLLVGGGLLGLIITGFFLAVSMTSGGGAWDNAKKYIEQGHFGGKGSPAYMAAVIGDTVGDPYKDTAGPSINPLIKIANLAALLLLALI